MFLTDKSPAKSRNKEELSGLADIIRLDGSRCPYPPSASVLTAVQDCADSSLREKPKSAELAEAAAELFGVSAENVCLCCCPAAAYAQNFAGISDRSAVLRPERPKIPENEVFLYDLGRCFGLFGVNAWALIASAENARRLRAVCEKLRAGAPDKAASAAVLAAVKDNGTAETWRTMEETTLRRTAGILRRLGFWTEAGEGPFLDIKTPEFQRLCCELLLCGIAVDSGEGYIRIWAGTDEEMERLYYCLSRIKERSFS